MHLASQATRFLRSSHAGRMERTSFKATSKVEPLYTGGKVLVSSNGEFFVCACTDEVLVVEFSTGKVVKRFEGDTSVITTLALHPNNTHVITCTRNLLIRNWSVEEVNCKKVWKGHTGPVIDCDYHPGGTLVATSSTDHTVKVWSPEGGFCTHNYVGHKGVVNLVRFFPSTRSRLLFSADDQCEIRIWNLDTPKESFVLINHMSLINAFGFNIDNDTLYSVGNDKVLNVWDLTTKKYEEERSLAVLTGETKLPKEAQAKISKLKKQHGGALDLIALGGVGGHVQVWCVDPVKGVGECVWKEEVVVVSSKIQPQIESFHWCQSSGLLACASSAQNIFFFDFRSGQLEKTKQFAGFLDSVLDLRFLDRKCTSVVAATNSHDLVVFGLDTHHTDFLAGHSDVVLAVDVSRDGKWILSGSRDHSVRLWDASTLKCVAEGKGHTDPVSSVAFGKKSNIFTSVSQDRTIKTWKIDGTNKIDLTVTATARGHDKDINTVDIAPNDKLIVTGSQDKSIKLWNASNLTQMGVFNGHRRGVWHVRFSPVDQCIASASADNTIRIWSLGDFSCIKTLEGHVVSVLRVEFLTYGSQLMSTGGDGVMKLWTIKTGACVMTTEAHDDKAWALCVAPEAKAGTSDPSVPDRLLVATGGADSSLCIWSDCSADVETERKQKEEELVLVEQRLNNSMASKDYHKALVYALSLGHKGRALDVLDAILVLKEKDKEEERDGGDVGGLQRGQARLGAVVILLTDEQLAKCLMWIRDWNTIGIER